MLSAEVVTCLWCWCFFLENREVHAVDGHDKTQRAAIFCGYWKYCIQRTQKCRIILTWNRHPQASNSVLCSEQGQLESLTVLLRNLSSNILKIFKCSDFTVSLGSAPALNQSHGGYLIYLFRSYICNLVASCDVFWTYIMHCWEESGTILSTISH